MSHDIIWEGNTPMGHYQVIDTLYDGRPARVLYSGDRQAAQSGVAKDSNPDLLFDYNQRMFELVTSLVPEKLLLIGGAVGTLPTALMEALPGIHIDMVEPDTGLTELAFTYFDLPVDDRLQVFHTDGRSFLREHATRYDMVLVDAFMHTTIPEDLKTLEAFQAYHKHLRPNGVLSINVISGYYGPSAYVLKQMCAAAFGTFQTVDVFLASRGYSLWLPQNFVLTAQKQTEFPLKDYMRYESVQPPEVSPNDALRDD
jgi:spermidine synthase